MNARGRCLAQAAIAAVIAGLLAWAMTRHGMVATPDGWVYWEASASLLRDDRLARLDGTPITEFGPLYPLFLAAVQSVAGVSGAALIGASIALAAIGAGLWAYPLLAVGRWPHIAAAVFVVAFMPDVAPFVLSESLQLVLLGALLLLLWQWHGELALLQASAIGALVLALLLTRNASIALVPGLALALALRRERWLSFFVAVLLPVMLWLAVRAALGQWGSHESGAANFTAAEYAAQLAADFARQLGSRYTFAGPALLGLMAVGLRRARALSPHVVIGATCIAALWILFNVARVNDPLEGRFLWAPLLCLVAGSALASTPTARLLPFVVVVVAAIQMARTVHHIGDAWAGETAANVHAADTIAPRPPR